MGEQETIWASGRSRSRCTSTLGINNARVMLPLVDINKGDKQIAHGIDRVLLPIKVSK